MVSKTRDCGTFVSCDPLKSSERPCVEEKTFLLINELPRWVKRLGRVYQMGLPLSGGVSLPRGVSSDRPCSKKGPCVLSGPNVVAENRCRRIARSSVEAREAKN